MFRNNFILLAILAVLSACSSFDGVVAGGSGVVTNDQYARIRFAIGTSKTISFLGISGINRSGLVLEAKKDLIMGPVYSLEKYWVRPL